MGGRTCGVDKFGAVFFADFESMDMARADGAGEFAGGIVNQDAARRVGGDIDVSGLIDNGATMACANGLVTRISFEVIGDVGEVEFWLGGGDAKVS